MNRALNLLGYDLVWTAAVLGAGHELPWLGVAAALAFLALHLVLFAEAGELRTLLSALTLGACLDGSLVLTRQLAFPSGAAAQGAVLPLWMVLLWACFAATLRHSLSWLGTRYLLAAAFGLIGGPLAYLGAERLGALSLSSAAPYWIALEWALAVPALSWLSRHPPLRVSFGEGEGEGEGA